MTKVIQKNGKSGTAKAAGLMAAAIVSGSLIAETTLPVKRIGDIHVLGVSIRTSNAEASETIPAHWGHFMESQIAQKIPKPTSDSLYAVYTNFENEGANNEGIYTFILGLQVNEDSEVPEGMELVKIAGGNYYEYPVSENKPENVFATWMEIWSTSGLSNAYVSDFEEYKSNGEITVNVGTTN